MHQRVRLGHFGVAAHPVELLLHFVEVASRLRDAIHVVETCT